MNGERFRKFRTPFSRQLSDKSSGQDEALKNCRSCSCQSKRRLSFFQEKWLVSVLELPLSYRVIHVNHNKAYFINVEVNKKPIFF